MSCLTYSKCRLHHTVLFILLVLAFPNANLNAQPYSTIVEKGKALFSSKACAGCHTFGKGELSGPDLKDVFSRRDPHWVMRWLTHTSEMAKSDPTAKKMIDKYALEMPDLNLSHEEAVALMAFMSKSGGGELDLSALENSQPKKVEKPIPVEASAPTVAEKKKPGMWSRLVSWFKSLFSSESDATGGKTVKEVAKARGLSPDDILAAVKTYMPTGKHDPFLMFSSGGHAGNVLVIGVPSMRIIKTIPVFTPDSWHGYGIGNSESTKMLDKSARHKGQKLRWGDVHHPALSETDGSYDGQFLFVNDKANARIAVIDLKDFVTKQIVTNPLYVNDHGGAFVTPNTEYVIETSQYNVPLPNRYEPLEKFSSKYKSAATFWKFDRQKGRIDEKNSFSIELPPYWHDLTDVGKQVSDGYAFLNTLNTEQATGGNLKGKPNIEVGASKNDMDFLHVIHWKRAAQLVAEKKYKVVAGMKLITLDTAISEGIVHLIHEPKSPHGIDVSPNGVYLVVSGKLDPHTTVYSFPKVKKAIEDKDYDGKDKYGVPILRFDAVKIAQVEVGLGPLHTQFDKDGYAYTSLFLDSAIARWTLGEPYFPKDQAWKVQSTVSVHYNIGHLSCIEGDTVAPGKGYCVALNKWALDRYTPVGPLLPQNFQLIDTSGDQMKVLYDLPIPNAEPHYVQIIEASKLQPIHAYPVGTNPYTMKKSPHAIFSGQERIERNGNRVTVYMTLIRSHLTPDVIEVNKGDHVTIHLTNVEAAKDATHGFAISDYNINLSVEPGEVETVEFTADRSGVFPYYCTEFCSALHLEMTGHLLVK